MRRRFPHNCLKLTGIIAAASALVPAFLPGTAWATQLHTSSEGIITHQIGHLFFLFSMVVLFFTITGKELDKFKGWRMIQASAFFFVLWNLDAIAAHFLDNQLRTVWIETISIDRIRIITDSNSSLLAWTYYILKLDHLFCVPAIFFLYRGLSLLVHDQKRINGKIDDRTGEQTRDESNGGISQQMNQGGSRA